MRKKPYPKTKLPTHPKVTQCSMKWMQSLKTRDKPRDRQKRIGDLSSKHKSKSEASADKVASYLLLVGSGIYPVELADKILVVNITLNLSWWKVATTTEWW